MKNKFLLILVLILRILGSIPIVLLFAFLSFWCAMIPIPIIGLIPFAICLVVESGLLCLVWWMPPSELDIAENSSAGQLLRLMGYSLLSVNGVGCFAKILPGIGTTAGFIINLICMILSTIVVGVLFLISGIKALKM